MLSLRQVPFGAEPLRCSAWNLGTTDGLWIGDGRHHLGADGWFPETEFATYLASLEQAITTAHPPAREHGYSTLPRPVAAYEMVCSIPLSMSVLYERTPDPEIREDIEASSSHAMSLTLAALQMDATATLRGADGIRALGVQDGVTALWVRHDQTATGLPDFHEHVVILNIVKGADGKWGTLDQQMLLDNEEWLSERHTSRLMDALESRIPGAQFTQRTDPVTGTKAWEITGSDPQSLADRDDPTATRQGACTR